MERLLGAVAIVAGAVIIGFGQSAFGSATLTLPSGYEIQFNVAVGLGLVVFGVIVAWHRHLWRRRDLGAP